MCKKIVSWVLSSCLLIAGWGLAANAVKAPALTDMAKPIVVAPGEEKIVLKLAANRTTGYEWFLVDYDRAILTAVSNEYLPPNSAENGLVGAPGVSIWTFKVNDSNVTVPVATKIKMVYARPWDVKDAETKIVDLVIYPQHD